MNAPLLRDPPTRIFVLLAFITALEILRTAQIVSNGFVFCLLLVLIGYFLLCLLHLAAERTSARAELAAFELVLKQHFFVLQTDCNGRFTTANDSYLTKVGLTLEALRQQPLGGLAQSTDQAGLSEMWTQVCGGQAFSGEFIDRLKIDRSFVSDLESNSDNLSIVQAIVQLGHSLGLATTAEGVENNQQATLLRAMGCGSLQGYHYSRPLPPERITLAPIRKQPAQFLLRHGH